MRVMRVDEIVARRLALAAALLLLAGCQSSSQPSDQAERQEEGERELVTRQMEPLTTGEAEPPEVLPAPAEPIDRSTAPEPGASRPYELPSVEEIELGNGLTALLIDRPGYPTVSARLSVRAGRDTHADNIAVPILTARTMRDGTTERSAEAIAAYIDGHGIDFNVVPEANRVVLAADALSTKLDQALALMTELAGQATFPDDRVASRRDELIAELDVASARPSLHRDRLTRRVAFGDHPYSALYATAEGAGSVTAEELRAFYASHYGPGRATLVLVGDLPDDVSSLLESTIGSWDRETAAYEPPPPVDLETCNTAHVVPRDDSAQTSILWVGPAPSITSDDYIDAVTANQVLGGGPSARLFLNLRQDKSYTYGAYSRLQNLLGAAWFTASSDVRSEVTGPALTEFVAEFARLENEALPDDEVADAKQYLSGSFPLQLETNAALASRLSSLVDQGLGVEYLETYRERVGAVGIGSAQAAAQTFADRAEMALVLVGEEEIILPAARANASTVYVYDLDGELVRELEGDLPGSCDAE